MPSKRASRGLRLGSLLFAIVLVSVAACSDSDEIESNTPRVTVSESVGELSDLLLTVDQVEAALGGSGLTQADISETPVFENPDPRGPCGGVVPQLPLGPDAVGRSFGASNITVVQFVTPTDAKMTAYLDAAMADATPGCAAFESETNQGLMQTVSDIEIVDVAAVSPTATAYVSRVEVGGQTFYAAVSAVSEGGATTFLQVGAQSPIDTQTVEALTSAATRALKGS